MAARRDVLEKFRTDSLCTAAKIDDELERSIYLLVQKEKYFFAKQFPTLSNGLVTIPEKRNVSSADGFVTGGSY